MLKKSVLNIEVSCFKNYETPGNPAPINLLDWLTSTKHKEKVDKIRAIDEKSNRDKMKAQLPVITPSGTFSYRSQDKLINHSGLIQIDIDLSKRNSLITNWKDLKSELSKIPNMAYLGKSVSGLGYWGLIPIPKEPENQRLYFEALAEIFLQNWGLELDEKPKNVASARGYSYDPEAYFNHQAKPFVIKKNPIPKLSTPFKYKRINASGLEKWLINKLEASQEGNRHGDRLTLARLAGGLVASGHLDYSIKERLIQSYLTQYRGIDSKQTQAKEIKAIQNGFENGIKSPIEPSSLSNQISQRSPITYTPTTGKNILEENEQIAEIQKQTCEVWRKISLVRNQIENLRVFETKEQSNRELLRQKRGW